MIPYDMFLCFFSPQTRPPRLARMAGRVRARRGGRGGGCGALRAQRLNNFHI